MRRRGGQVDRRALLEEAFEALTLTEAGLTVSAPHTLSSYDRLVEVSVLLGVEAPPPLSTWDAGRRASDDWAARIGLLHRGCRYERNGEHWAFHCRG